MVNNPNKENKMEDPKLAMKQMRSIVKEFLPKFAAGETVDNCYHFGDAVALYSEEDVVRLVICLQDVATSEKAKKERAGEHILNLKRQMEVLRQLRAYDVETIQKSYSELRMLQQQTNELNFKVQELHEALAQAYTQRDAAMILLKEKMNA